MIVYKSTSKLKSGPHKGKLISEVFQEDIEHLEELMINDITFIVDEVDLQRMLKTYPNVDLSDSAIEANFQKIDDMDDDSDDDAEEDSESLLADDDFEEEDLDLEDDDLDLELDDDLSDDDDDFEEEDED